MPTPRDMFPLDLAFVNAIGALVMLWLGVAVWPMFAASAFFMVLLYRWKSAPRKI
jgi:hypothetical protein